MSIDSGPDPRATSTIDPWLRGCGRGGRRSWQSRFPLFTTSVTVIADCDDTAAAHEAIDDGSAGDGNAEHSAPFTGGQVPDGEANRQPDPDPSTAFPADGVVRRKCRRSFLSSPPLSEHHIMFRNHFSVLGNTSAEPTLRRTLAGRVVATVNVATNFRHKDTEGRWIEATERHRITAFDQLAKELHESVRKGTRVAADGYVCTRKFVDVNHQNRYVHELVATRIEVGDSATRAVDRDPPLTPPAEDSGLSADAASVNVI
jgi:single-strand DNA-binding protein